MRCRVLASLLLSHLFRFEANLVCLSFCLHDSTMSELMTSSLTFEEPGANVACTSAAYHRSGGGSQALGLRLATVDCMSLVVARFGMKGVLALGADLEENGVLARLALMLVRLLAHQRLCCGQEHDEHADERLQLLLNAFLLLDCLFQEVSDARQQMLGYRFVFMDMFWRLIEQAQAPSWPGLRAATQLQRVAERAQELRAALVARQCFDLLSDTNVDVILQ